RGWHVRVGEPHAEVNALWEAGNRCHGATAYVTLEPCSHYGRTPPCSQALIDSGIERVVVGMEDPNPLVAGSGLKQLADSGILVERGLLREQAEALNPGFILRMRDKRPFVRCKMAMSIDGRTAMASGESKWITGPDARRDVQRLRARSSAIITGIGTVLADDPSMTVRAGEIGECPGPGEWRQPLRVIVDPHLSTPPQARILSVPGKTLLATTCDEADITEVLTAKGTRIIRFPGSSDAVDLQALLTYLATEEVNEILLESGATLCGAMLQAGLIDELVIYIAPILMGDTARGLFSLPGLEHMADRVKLDIMDIRSIGTDLKITIKMQD
ncbi:MAG: bifunctional diaminohydroxyphosphoribosylaminopyrimidine deaminase/5-amino-6-(5-phosphoribosylamino)uracil reductase RibD, partial [Gammaproteobacteria bacterium]|nr:bifunctional diaminohydroxyphosphoribosylaminopyrimidine deaminase/5-amino-6-(5-phosphoribosylamino)uracil reductase RibD [Gammaproteobacteria bacterium]